MKLLFGKMILYSVLIFIALEIITRVFYLYSEFPVFIINDKNIRTYAPNQDGYYVMGNRRMNFAAYHVNNSGFNFYKEYTPSKDKIDIALVGDSFIDGLHQNYYNSISVKIKKKLNNGTEVFQYGQSGFDLTDEFEFMSVYKDQFDLMDKIIIYLKFENDIERCSYEPDQYWVDTQYFFFSRVKRKVKFLIYLDQIGALDSARDLKERLVRIGRSSQGNVEKLEVKEEVSKDAEYLENFKKLVATYGFDKDKTCFLLDAKKTSKVFLDHCHQMGYEYIDFSEEFAKSKKKPTLVYDKHWNNHGRNIIADVIANYLKKDLFAK